MKERQTDRDKGRGDRESERTRKNRKLYENRKQHFGLIERKQEDRLVFM